MFSQILAAFSSPKCSPMLIPPHLTTVFEMYYNNKMALPVQNQTDFYNLAIQQSLGSIWWWRCQTGKEAASFQYFWVLMYKLVCIFGNMPWEYLSSFTAPSAVKTLPGCFSNRSLHLSNDAFLGCRVKHCQKPSQFEVSFVWCPSFSMFWRHWTGPFSLCNTW